MINSEMGAYGERFLRHRSSPSVFKIQLVDKAEFSRESQQMLYFVQQKRGNKPYLRLNVVKCATFWALFPGLKPISPKLLHKMQHSPSAGAKRPENVAFFAGFVAGVPGEEPR